MVGFMLTSGFGIFFSDEQANSQGYILTQVISELNNEYIDKIEKIKIDNPHDILIFATSDGAMNQIKWITVLSVYAVKVATDPNNTMDVVTIDDTKKAILRTVLFDMNSISYTISEQEKGKYELNNEVSELEITTKTILTIYFQQRSSTDMINLYKFNLQQQEQLKILEDEKNNELCNPKKTDKIISKSNYQ